MGDEIKVNGGAGGESPEELQKKQQLEQARAQEQSKTNLNNDLTAGLSGTRIDTTNLNSGLGFGGIFNGTQMNVDQQQLNDLSKSFLGFTLGVSQLPLGLGENFMTASITNWFSAFMNCFKGGNTAAGDITGGFGGIVSGGGIGGGGKTTLIKEEDKVDETPEEVTTPEKVDETPEVDSAKKAREAEEAKKAKEAEETRRKAETEKKIIDNDDLTSMNREQFLKWLDKKGYKSEIGNDPNVIDFVTDSSTGYKNRITFSRKTGMSSLIFENGKSTTINYLKDGTKSVTVKTEKDERYSYTETTDYDKSGKKKSHKKTERDAGNYFKRQWVGAAGVEYTDIEKSRYNVSDPIEGLQDKATAPEFKSGQTGYVYDPQKGTLDGKDTVFTKLKDGGFSATDKKTGATYQYDKDGKLTKQIDYSQGIIRDFHKDGTYDEQYKKEWVKK